MMYTVFAAVTTSCDVMGNSQPYAAAIIESRYIEQWKVRPLRKGAVIEKG